jgi:hypothetical protein
MDDPSEYVDFMAKYKGWLSIKRLGIRPNTSPQEIVMHLSNIRSAIDSRAYRILGINTEALDSLASRISSGKPKSPESLAFIIKELNSPETKKEISSACSTETAAKAAQIYVFNKALESLNYDTSIKPQLMAKLFPELKLSVPRGMGRKKRSRADSDE